MGLFAAAICLGAPLSAYAEDAPPAGPTPLTSPALSAPPPAQAKPVSYDFGDPLGPIYVGGVASGLLFTQNHRVPGDHKSYEDISNGQVFIQNTSGFVQFYAQAGIYSLPSLGTPYTKASTITSAT